MGLSSVWGSEGCIGLSSVWDSEVCIGLSSVTVCGVVRDVWG